MTEEKDVDLLIKLSEVGETFGKCIERKSHQMTSQSSDD